MNKELEALYPISPQDRVIEECSELIQALMKAKRFGWASRNPVTGVSNYDQIILEMSDVVQGLARLHEEMEKDA